MIPGGSWPAKFSPEQLSFIFLFFQAGGMAFGAIFQLALRDPFFDMFGPDLGRFVFMARIAGVLSIAGKMADLAIYFTLVTMINWKRMLAEFGRRPEKRCMAADTVESERARMDFGLHMTIDTFIGRAGEDRGRMTGDALDDEVGALQGKNERMIETNHRVQPVVADRTLLTVEIDVAGDEVRISVGVTIKTINHYRIKLFL